MQKKQITHGARSPLVERYESIKWKLNRAGPYPPCRDWTPGQIGFDMRNKRSPVARRFSLLLYAAPRHGQGEQYSNEFHYIRFAFDNLALLH